MCSACVDAPGIRRGKPSASTRRTSRKFAPATGNDASETTPSRSSNDNNGKAPPLPVAAGKGRPLTRPFALDYRRLDGGADVLYTVQTSVVLERLEIDE